MKNFIDGINTELPSIVEIEKSTNSINKDLLLGILDEYFQILNAYAEKKEKLNKTTVEVSKICGLPELTIRRFEKMYNYPTALNLIKILNSVGLKLVVVPIEEKSI